MEKFESRDKDHAPTTSEKEGRRAKRINPRSKITQEFWQLLEKHRKPGQGKRNTVIISQQQMQKEIRRHALSVVDDDPLPARPRTRAECESSARPCCFVSCKHSTYLNVDKKTGAIKLNFPFLEPEEMPMDASCVLDIAEREGLTLEDTGAVMNVTKEAMSREQEIARNKAKKAFRRMGITEVPDFLDNTA